MHFTMILGPIMIAFILSIGRVAASARIYTCESQLTKTPPVVKALHGVCRKGSNQYTNAGRSGYLFTCDDKLTSLCCSHDAKKHLDPKDCVGPRPY
ncbi:hypothetical protein MJO29_008252 [Puccinia striiformis f. sp. tritici]|uniref:Secreted protein n=1 Tax=Puccinia striiformis f. sp. tritici PST-78 TaxID=1165861 RepID=A0A0L0VJB1_9BASI|nr:hypothetical protein Pst134EA_015569 [Puccinia striiformis f. sp. tritici]KAI9610199.1 hypothetical protein KEM48_002630 [Puccinia striiformis f. sp. tritici PST-130]KNE99069.1 hypothetical protein PSTG_07720 [Puccinia striiformis f. sp. tritici PST-78]KAH9452737.1 hypothetical protein Pst134EB_016690 [Puccinia striiformis f. sp. tritici]KAH9463486.1 hypothetical protein Pst134EA_015569 [Puccinia striiformis f. sp. tritici]KAI7952621.1 hypothetical protein MJO29_008252 [Puccinia striiformis